LPIKIGKIPIEVSVSVRPVVSASPETAYEVLCNTRFTGFNNFRDGRDSITIRTGEQTVIGKIVVVKDTLGHQEIVAATLDAARLYFKLTEHDGVFHVGNTSRPNSIPRSGNSKGDPRLQDERRLAS
jgi:hypothetical protein